MQMSGVETLQGVPTRATDNSRLLYPLSLLSVLLHFRMLTIVSIRACRLCTSFAE
jgi:hypothetical protein